MESIDSSRVPDSRGRRGPAGRDCRSRRLLEREENWTLQFVKYLHVAVTPQSIGARCKEALHSEFAHQRRLDLPASGSIVVEWDPG